MTGIGVSSGPVGCLTFSTVVAPCRWATAEEEDEREEEEAATNESCRQWFACHLALGFTV